MMIRKNNKKSKRSQVTIFVIIAVIIVMSVIAVFMLAPKITTVISGTAEPSTYIEKCAKIALDEAVSKISLNGGYADPIKSGAGYIKYENRNIAFLCYTSNNGQLCLNKEPMLSERIKKEITSEIKADIESCFSSYEKSLRGYSYESGQTVLNAEITPDQILLNINKSISVTKQDKTIRINSFPVRMSSPLYDFIELTNEIINQEVSCGSCSETCNADVVKLAMENRDYSLRRFITGKGEEIYSIEEIDTGKKFSFAVRNCVRAP